MFDNFITLKVSLLFAMLVEQVYSRFNKNNLQILLRESVFWIYQICQEDLLLGYIMMRIGIGKYLYTALSKYLEASIRSLKAFLE